MGGTMQEVTVLKGSRRTKALRRVGVAVAAVGLSVGLTLVASPAANADSWGYVNCQPNNAPASRVVTMSHSNGSVRHTQTNGTTYSKTYNFSGWRTYRWNANQRVNERSTVNVAAALVHLWSADRYCQGI